MSQLFVTGRILDPDGHPLAGARALASDWRADPDSCEGEGVQLEALTDATGRFRLGPFLGQQNGLELKVWVEPGESTGAAADLARLRVEEVAYLLHQR